MIDVTHYPNVLAPVIRTQRQVDAGTTLRALTVELAGQREWLRPTVALVNGKPKMRATWDEPLPDGAVVEFRSIPEGGKNGGFVIGALQVAAGAALLATGVAGPAGVGLIVGGAISLAATALMPRPDVPSYLNEDSGSPTYSIDYKANRKRVGDPIPVVYGRHRLYPDLVSQSYVHFEDNDQYVTAILCLGVGEFEIHEETMRFGEALFSELKNVEWEKVEPGDNLTMVRDHVTTSGAINGQELVGPSADVTAAESTSLTIALSSHTQSSSNPFIAAGTYLAIDISADRAIFGPVNSTNGRDTVRIIGSADNDGYHQVYEKLSSTAIRVERLSGAAGESPYHCQVRITGPDPGTTDLVDFPPSVTFEATGNYIQMPSGTFLSLTEDSVITVSNTASNDGAYTVISINTSGSRAYVNETVVDEVATNADVVLSAAGWSGWFEVAGPGDVVEQLEIDLVATRGMGEIDGSSVDSHSVTAEVQYQGLDAGGAPVGSQLNHDVTVSGSSVRPVRVSDQWDNDTGEDRVRFRFRRSSVASGNPSILDTVQVTGFKGYLPDVTTYDGVTIVAVRAKATEQISSQQSGQVNFEATRKVSIYDDGTDTWGATTASSSIAWALADALRNADYGAGIPDDEIDIAALVALDAVWTTRADEFNGVFDQTLTCWEMLQRIARAGRAQPVLSGGVITFVRDGERTTRAAMFTPVNILPGSLGIEYRLPQEQDPDGTRISWMDPRTWQQAHVEYKEGGGTIYDPQEIDLFGVTDEDQALREATYLDRVRKLVRKTITWRTEMDGHLVSVGDLVALSHDVPAWGQAGELVGIVGTTYTSTEPLVWTPAATHYVLLRRRDGSVSGPHVVTEVIGQPHQFTLTAALGFTPSTDLSAGDRTAFTFGPSTTYSQDVVISAVTPADDSTVELQAVPYVAAVHASGA